MTTYTDMAKNLERSDLSDREKLAYVCLLIYAHEAQAMESSEFGFRQDAFARCLALKPVQTEALLVTLKKKGLIRSYSALETIDSDSYWMIELPYPEEDGSEATA